MPLSDAERTRRYRERLKNEPEKLEIQRKKNLERIKNTKKKITQLTLKEAAIRREKWKEYQRRSRMRKQTKNIDIHKENETRNENHTSQDTCVLSPRRDSREDKKMLKKLQKKCKYLANKCRRYTAYNKLLKTQKETNGRNY